MNFLHSENFRTDLWIKFERIREFTFSTYRRATKPRAARNSEEIFRCTTIACLKQNKNITYNICDRQIFAIPYSHQSRGTDKACNLPDINSAISEAIETHSTKLYISNIERSTQQKHKLHQSTLKLSFYFIRHLTIHRYFNPCAKSLDEKRPNISNRQTIDRPFRTSTYFSRLKRIPLASAE